MCCRSEDYKGKLIDIRMPANNKLMLLLLQFRKTILDDHDFKRINCYFNLIGECLNGPYEKSGVTYLVMALLYDVGNIMSTSQQHSSPQKKEEELYTKFMQLLQCEYDTLPRTLIYYAEKLKVTSNHLGVVVKKVSGNTPLQWINKVSIEQSKYLIINNELSMNQIAYKVGFSSQTSFCRFFKKEVGLSPLEYLQSYRVRQAVK